MRSRLLIPLALLLVAPAAASASTIEVVDKGTGEVSGARTYEITYRADPGEANQLTIQLETDRRIRLADPGATLHDLPPECAPVGAGALCTTPRTDGLWHGATAVLGDRDDTAVAEAIAASLAGGPGADDLRADQGLLIGGLGPDRLDGGPATSVTAADYRDHSSAVSVTLDGVANDGSAGEGDNVVGGISTLIGGSGDDELSLVGGPVGANAFGGMGDDHIVGGGGADGLRGELGDDRIDAGAGDDTLDGGGGADILRGGRGTDLVSYASSFAGVNVTLDDHPGDGAASENDDVGSDVENVTGGSGPDVIVGSAAANVLVGSGGADRIFGEAGDDTLVAPFYKALSGGPGRDLIQAGTGDGPIDAADGEVDTISCSVANSQLRVDSIDTVTGCRSAPTVDPPAAAMTYRGARRVRVGSRGHARIAIGCSGSPCRGKLVIRYGGVKALTIGRSSFDLAASAKPARLSIAISKKGLRLLRRDRKHPVTVLAQLGDGPSVSVGTLTLLRPAR
jgi:hypothetical protein